MRSSKDPAKIKNKIRGAILCGLNCNIAAKEILSERIFLGDSDIENPNNHKWHTIYTLEKKSNGNYYATIEGFKGSELSGLSDVFKKI